MITASRTIQARVHRIIGQMKAIENMANHGKECHEILYQISAVRAGIEKIASIVFRKELERLGQKGKLQQHELERLTNIYSKTT